MVQRPDTHRVQIPGTLDDWQARNHYFERRSVKIAPDCLAQRIVAFANASVGKLMVGIGDLGEAIGFNSPRSRPAENFEQCVIMNCTPAHGPSTAHASAC
ncbi:RNA-binding domain-containing protein [Bifidobacterium longum]|uniref:Schlafen AlbA-2 domain-containing protein n=1 Tax=Bifidobacterium longum subsp. longum TaxID=1679 RepID=A0A9Q8VIJ1_BIFLL|nr:hypothetical protein G8B15_00305 [Bifidobacterium longum subsp. longum]UNL68070.1 hypothetical protein G8B14_09450 [Bifidobacterium longum subsp. longum]UNL70250.1 hypothetical protein G8B13_10510 [Bifidobacterium longum subsp. longum]UNL71636.1 hypothetical protein G8B12_06995 [Bifidobacterium longum subsp. longum]UNL82636.1 hypothetical protein G8B11_10490 [Bifidobacterium longum subsp. longum]